MGQDKKDDIRILRCWFAQNYGACLVSDSFLHVLRDCMLADFMLSGIETITGYTAPIEAVAFAIARMSRTSTVAGDTPQLEEEIIEENLRFLIEALNSGIFKGQFEYEIVFGDYPEDWWDLISGATNFVTAAIANERTDEQMSEGELALIDRLNGFVTYLGSKSCFGGESPETPYASSGDHPVYCDTGGPYPYRA